MNVAPGATFEALSPELASGLAGTVGVRIRDGIGADFLARTTAGIAADVTVGATSVYRKTLTAPMAAGQFWIVWDDGTSLSDPVELVVTAELTAATIGSGHLYVTRNELKEILLMNGTEYADDAIDVAVAAASEAINAYKKTRYYPTTEVRLYTAQYRETLEFDGGGLNAITSLEVDTDGDGTYEETWELGVDFVLEPANAAADGRPYSGLRLRDRASRVFPSHEQAIRVSGSFGWAEAPSQVPQAAIFLANRFLDRTREAPLGIIVQVAGELVATARLGRIDPDVAFLLDQLPGADSRQFSSLQLS